MATTLATTITKGATIQASDTWNPASIAAGASVTLVMASFTGVALGDLCFPSFSLDLAGLTLTAYVNAAASVTVVLANNTAGAVDLASGTITVRVEKIS